MSVEDLEIHQPGDSPGKKQYLPLRASLGDGPDSVLQRGKGILRGGSLPSLVDVSAHPNEEDEVTNATNHKEQTFINVVVEQI